MRWCAGLTPALERLDDDHVSTAAWARQTGIERLFRHVVIERWRDRQQFACTCEAGLARRTGEQAVVAMRWNPRGRHYGFLASAGRKDNVARARELLAAPAPTKVEDAASLPDLRPPCPCCGGHMVIIEIFQRAARARAPPSSYPFTRTTVS